MYAPNEANKPYLTLLKEKGVSSAIKSALFVISMYIFNKLVAQQDTPIESMIVVYFFFCIYQSWRKTSPFRAVM